MLLLDAGSQRKAQTWHTRAEANPPVDGIGIGIGILFGVQVVVFYWSVGMFTTDAASVQTHALPIPIPMPIPTVGTFVGA